MVFFSESLGSRILLDSISEMAFAVEAGSGTEPQQSAMLVDNLVSAPFFMFANQLPMLEVGLGDYSRGARLGQYSDMAGPDTPPEIARCLGEVGVGPNSALRYANLAWRLRRFRDHGVAREEVRSEDVALFGFPEHISDLAATARESFNDLHAAIAACRRANEQLYRTNSEALYARYSGEVSRRLAGLTHPGPLGLDLYLQRKAIQAIPSANETDQGTSTIVKHLDHLAFKIYAFSDANDLLTWEVNDDFKRKFGMVDFVNVQTRVALPALPVQGALGVFVAPTRAHLNYRHSNVALDVILCILGEDATKASTSCQPKHLNRD